MVDRLHPEAKAALQYMMGTGAKAYYEYESAQAAREAYVDIAKNLQGTCEEFKGKVDDKRVPSPDVQG